MKKYSLGKIAGKHSNQWGGLLEQRHKRYKHDSKVECYLWYVLFPNNRARGMLRVLVNSSLKGRHEVSKKEIWESSVGEKDP